MDGGAGTITNHFVSGETAPSLGQGVHLIRPRGAAPVINHFCPDWTICSAHTRAEQRYGNFLLDQFIVAYQAAN
jgi:hypothetical protein